jgi:hypothetical protein
MGNAKFRMIIKTFGSLGAAVIFSVVPGEIEVGDEAD